MKVKNIMFFGAAAAILSAAGAMAAPNYTTVSNADLEAGRKIVASKSYVDSQANKLEADITAVATSAVSNLDYAGNGDAGVVVNVTQTDGAITATKAQITDSEVADNANIAQSKINGLVSDLAAKEVTSHKSTSALISADENNNITTVAAGSADNYASTSALSADFTTIKNAITAAQNASTSAVNGLDMAQVGGNGEVVLTVTQADGQVSATAGKIADANVADNANIAQSKINGLVSDLAAKEVTSHKSTSALISADENNNITTVAAGSDDNYASTSALSADFTTIKNAIDEVAADVAAVPAAQTGTLTVTGKGSGATQTFNANQATGDALTVTLRDLPVKPSSCNATDPCTLLQTATGYGWFHMVTDQSGSATTASTVAVDGSIVTE